MNYIEDNLLSLSALQHYIYCPRQCALIHIEQQWVENRFTAEGRAQHERVDRQDHKTRDGVRIEYAVPLRSLQLGLIGKADAIEFHPDYENSKPDSSGLVYPVEHKRGRPKPTHCDWVQLCAQALCLEEMMNIEILEGAVFYGQPRRRQVVVFDSALRDHADKSDGRALATAESRLTEYLRRLEKPATIEYLRGIEGEAASSYFAAFPQLITIKEEAFTYTGRNRRPPLDPINALLSFVYTLLVHDCRSALEGVGLDPCVGYLHADRPGRPSLALDLMEEFRSFLADRLVLSLINRRQIKASDFNDSLGGAVMMKDEARKKLLISWQKRKQEEITHPYLCEKTKVGLLAHLQALLLARHLRGDLEAYPPFIWK